MARSAGKPAPGRRETGGSGTPVPDTRRRTRRRRRRAPACRGRRSGGGADARKWGGGTAGGSLMTGTPPGTSSRPVTPWTWNRRRTEGCRARDRETRKGPGTDRGTRRCRRTGRGTRRCRRTDLRDTRVPPGPAAVGPRGPGPGHAVAAAQGRRGLHRQTGRARACSTRLPTAKERACSRGRSAHRARGVRPGRQAPNWWWASRPGRSRTRAVLPGWIPARSTKSSPRTSRARRPPRARGIAVSDAVPVNAPCAVVPALSPDPGPTVCRRNGLRQADRSLMTISAPA